MAATVYLIPCFLHEDGLQALPAYVTQAVQQCDIFFVENERSARRYFKQLWSSIVIDNYEWHTIHKAEAEVVSHFKNALKQNKTIGIVSEAGCPGVADPGQILIGVAQQAQATVKPLTGPSSILLALMASGMNGQQFQFVGYLPVDNGQRMKQLKELEEYSRKKNCTQIFIETPYRNNQLLETILKTAQPNTQLCVAVNLTGPEEWVKTKTIAQWKQQPPDMHKQPAIFLLYAGN